MKIKNVVKVMNFQALLRMDKALRQADKYKDVGKEITDILGRILYNKNLILGKRILTPSEELPELNIYIANDYGFCGNFNSEVSRRIKKDTEKWSISVLREKAEQILCPCDKSCDYAIQLEGVMVCKPISISYCRINEDEEKAIARHEITMNLEELMTAAKYILKNKAPLYLVHRCDRLEEILDCLAKYNFKVKKLQFVYAGYNKEAIMVLIKATKNGKMGSLKVMPPVDVLEHKSYKGIFEKGE